MQKIEHERVLAGFEADLCRMSLSQSGEALMGFRDGTRNNKALTRTLL